MSHEHERAFSASLIYLGLGAVAAAAIQVFDIAWLDPFDDAKVIEHIAEVALIFALFSSGLKLDRPLRWREWGSVTRLLALAMPLTMAGVALFGTQVMGLSLGAALLLGAMLSPTDPVLAGDIGVGPPGDEAEHEPNFALTAEAGGNDGLAAPLVLIGIFVAEEGGTGWLGEWLVADLLYACAAGVAIGAAVGLVGGVERPLAARPRAAGADLRRLPRGRHRARALRRRRDRRRLRLPRRLRRRPGLPPLRARPRAQRRASTTGAEQVEKFMELAAILLLGSLLTGAGPDRAGLGGLAARGRAARGHPPAERVPRRCIRSQVQTAGGRTFVAWFGVRGVGTLYYASTSSWPARLSGAEERLVVWTAIACVILSIVVHGVTGGPALRLLFRNLREEERQGARRSGRDPLQRRRRLPLVEQVEHGLLDHRLVDRQLAGLGGVGDRP